MDRPRRAIIIGGGIAGPALALFLARAGIEAVVMEAYPRTDDVGGGFQIAPNGMRVLAELGLLDSLLTAGCPSSDFCFRNHRGKIIGVARTGSAGSAVNVARSAVQRILRDALDRAGITVHYNKRLRDITLSGSQVVATFEDGCTEVGDFLVGADGVHSRVRAWMLPEHTRPRDTGMVSIGAFCARDYAHCADPEDAARLTFVVGPQHQFGYSKMSASHWGWWCHAVANDGDGAPLLDQSLANLRERLLQRYAGWSAPVSELIRATETWLRTPIYDVPSLPTWHRGRVVLIGDAAHAMSPAGGQGASLALEDAQLLAKLVTESSTSLETALTAFERLRRPRAEKLVAQGYANDQRTLKQLGPFALWTRDRVLFPLMAPVMARILTRIYASRIDDRRLV